MVLEDFSPKAEAEKKERGSWVDPPEKREMRRACLDFVITMSHGDRGWDFDTVEDMVRTADTFYKFISEGEVPKEDD